MDTHAFRTLSICSGVGGLDLGLRLAVLNARTVCYVENEAFACSTLVARIQDSLLDDAPIWTDLRTFDSQPWRGAVDCIMGGFPCQPFSDAGRKQGVEDPRHLWPYIARIIQDIHPAWCFFENVRGLLSTRTPDRRYAYQVIEEDLHRLGYTVESGLFSAEEVGATHRRVRLFILAHRNTSRELQQDRHVKEQRERAINSSKDVAFPIRLGWRGRNIRSQPTTSSIQSQTQAEGSGIELEYPQRVNVEGGQSFREWDSINPLFSNTIRDMDDSFQSRLEGRWPDGSDPDQLPTWPPSPEDTDEWRQVIEIAPHLKPTIHRMADGLDSDVDSARFAHRQDRLRAVGNGVVPLTVGLAFTVLYYRIINS